MSEKNGHLTVTVLSRPGAYLCIGPNHPDRVAYTPSTGLMSMSIDDRKLNPQEQQILTRLDAQLTSMTRTHHQMVYRSALRHLATVPALLIAIVLLTVWSYIAGFAGFLILFAVCCRAQGSWKAAATLTRSTFAPLSANLSRR